MRIFYFKPFVFFIAFAVTGLFWSCDKDDTTPDDTDDTVITPDPDPDPTPGAFAGEIEWVKTFGGSDEDDATSVIQTLDGGYLVLGTTKSTDGDVVGKSSIDRDFWLLKLDTAGEIQWQQTYGGSEDDVASKITGTTDGGYIISGYSRSSDGDVSGNEGFQDYWVLKVTASGTVEWNKNFGFSGSDQAFDAFQTSDGGYFITGFLDVTASGNQGNDLGKNNDLHRGLHGVGEFWGIKLDANGTKEWRRYFGGSNNDRSYAALETADGGFLMTGSSESDDFDITDSKGSYDFWAVRVNAAGDLLWTKSFGGVEIDIAYALTKTADGNYLMAGDTRSSDQDVTTSFGNADVWLVKFSDSGNLLWQKSIGGSSFDSARSVQLLENGSFLIAGNTRSADGDLSENKGANDAWMGIVDQNGALQHSITVGGSMLDFGNAAIKTTDNKVIMVGNTESNDFDVTENKGIKDFIITKFK